MTTPIAYPRELSPMLQWAAAERYRELWGADRNQGPLTLQSRTEYAIRRVGGLKNLFPRMKEFEQAYNEAPFADADIWTELQADEEMKRMSDGGVQRVKR